jgi:hypothetical protein
MAREIITKTNASSENTRILLGAQSNDHSACLAGVSTRRFFTDADTFARVQLLVTKYYRLDVLSNFWDVYNVEAEALGQKIVYPPGAIPDIDRSEPLIRTPSDLDRLSPPDPYRSGRLPWVQQFSRIFWNQRVTWSGSISRPRLASPPTSGAMRISFWTCSKDRVLCIGFLNFSATKSLPRLWK